MIDPRPQCWNEKNGWMCALIKDHKGPCGFDRKNPPRRRIKIVKYSGTRHVRPSTENQP